MKPIRIIAAAYPSATCARPRLQRGSWPPERYRPVQLDDRRPGRFAASCSRASSGVIASHCSSTPWTKRMYPASSDLPFVVSHLTGGWRGRPVDSL
jgi:hypothetical protein